MAKTDKEYTIDVVCEYLKTWGNQNCQTPVSGLKLPELITSVYNAIHSLEDEKPKEDTYQTIHTSLLLLDLNNNSYKFSTKNNLEETYMEYIEFLENQLAIANKDIEFWMDLYCKKINV